MKSDVSTYLRVAEAIYIDACAKCPADVSDVRDLETIRSRVKNEGLSFLTILLPRFCQDFERSLATGELTASGFQNFRKTGRYPSFLKGLVGHIFDFETGRIYDENNSTFVEHFPTFVDSIRQICLAFKKVELDCQPERVAKAISNFVEIERSFTSSAATEDNEKFSRVSSVLWDNLIYRLRDCELVPRHGPGATAERISGNRKYAWRYWYERLDNYFPLFSYAYSIGAIDSKEVELVTFVNQESELPVRVITVPKTLKSPRIIAIEPVCMQYAQQGIRSILYEQIESYDLTAGHINFSDQSVNQLKAIEASKTGRLATIDLSDASDRVPRDLALSMFNIYPEFRDAIDACRSRSALLPNGEIISPLMKFASMGSALCFPIEAMYFYTICVIALLDKARLPVSRDSIFMVSRDIHVYGDDIIVPTHFADSVLECLQKYNCRANTNKTFYSGKFRESCGVDAYDGELVTPVYLRKAPPENRQQASELLSYTATGNLFYKKGYWRTAALLFSIVERHLGPLPYVSEDSSGLGVISFLGYRSVSRWNSKLHRFEVKAWVPSPVYRTDLLDGYAALTKCLLKLEASTFEPHEDVPFMRVSDDLSDPRDPKHLERTARHGAVTLQRRWVPA